MVLREPRPSIARALLGAGVVFAFAVAGCTPGPDAGGPPSASTPPSAPAPAPPVGLVPDGTAADNLPLFTQVTQAVWSGGSRSEGRAYIDALVAAGFERARMQVTEDQTTVGNPVESLQFSVAWGDDECLIGQIGPSTGDPVTAVMPQLAEGRCLIGETRPIDW